MAYFNIEQFLEKVNRNGFQRTTQFRCRIPVANIGSLFEGLGTPVGRRLVGKYAEASRLLSEGLLCERTTTPSRQLDTTTMTIYGLEEKYPVFTTYTDHECTFLAPLIYRDGKHHNDVANIFHEWQDAVQDANVPQRWSTGSRPERNQQFPDDYRLTEGLVLDQFSTYNPKRRGGILGVNINAQGNVRDGIEGFNRVSRWFDGPQIPTSWTNRQSSDDDDSEGPTLSYKFFNVFPLLVQSTQVAWMGDADIQRVTVSFAYSYWNAEQTETMAWTS